MDNSIAIIDTNLVSSLFAASGTSGGIAADTALNDLISLHPSTVVTDTVFEEILDGPYGAEFQTWFDANSDKITRVNIDLADVDAKYETNFSSNPGGTGDSRGDFTIRYLIEHDNADGRYSGASVYTNDRGLISEINNLDASSRSTFDFLHRVALANPEAAQRYLAEIIDTGSISSIPDEILRENIFVYAPAAESMGLPYHEIIRDEFEHSSVVVLDLPNGEHLNVASTELKARLSSALDKIDGGIVGSAAIGLLVLGVAGQADAAISRTYGEDYTTADVLDFIQNSNLPISADLLTSIAEGALQDVLLKGVASLMGVGLLWTAYDVWQNIDGLTEALDFAAQSTDSEALDSLNTTVQGVKTWLDDRFGSNEAYVPQHAELAALIESQFDYETKVLIGSAIKDYLADFGITPGLLRDDVAGWMTQLQNLVDVASADQDSGITSLQDALQAALFNSDDLTVQQKIALDPTRCFPAGTLITMWDGSRKNIENILIDDQVLSFDNNGCPQPGYVTRLFRNVTTEWMRLNFDDGQAPMHVTPGHRFLTETGHYLEIGHMVRLGGGTARVIVENGSVREVRGELIRYAEETARQFDEASARSAVGDTASFTTEGWQTFNFEVQQHHNYVAEGVRVHNDSIFAFLQPHEIPLVTQYRDTDGDSYPDFVVIHTPGRTSEKEKYLATVDGQSVAIEEITFSDGNGNVLYQKLIIDEDNNVIGREEPRYLTGQFAGEAIGQTLTPFLTKAILGEGASQFEVIATNTVLGTVLDNLGGTIGALINRKLIDEGEFALSENFETISKVVFEDFGGELIVNGINNTTNAINQLIMAEIFEFIDADGIPGAIYQSVIGVGVNNVVSHGVEWLVNTEGFEAFFGGNDKLYTQVKNGVKASDLPETFWGEPGSEGVPTQVGWASVILGAVIQEVLPDLETLEGQIASAVASTALSVFGTLSSLGAFAGPVGAVISWAIGALVDALFDKDPQAWTNVGFNEETGRFELTGTWSDDGGDIELSQALAQAYVNGMNGFVDTMMSQSHNYSELAQWSFGHYEDALRNAGQYGITFADFQDTYLDAYIRDLAKVKLEDGQMTAVRALQGLNLDSLVNHHGSASAGDPLVFSEILNEDGETTSIVEGAVEGAIRQIVVGPGDVQSYDGLNPIQIYQLIASRLQIAADYHTYLENTAAINTLIQASPNTAFAAGWYTTIAEAERLGLTYSYNLTGDAVDNEFYTGEANDTIAGAAGDDLIKTYLGDDSLSGDSGNDTLHGGAGTDQVLGGVGDDSLEGGAGADFVDGGAGEDWATFATSANGVVVNLFDGVGYEGEAAGDEYVGIENLRGSNFSDELVGDDAVNKIEALDGNDSIFGRGANDSISGGDGDDTIYGDLADDTSVTGADTLRGDAGDDILHGGPGFDYLVGGEGHDRASYRYSTDGVISSIATGETKIYGGIETFIDIEGLIGSSFADILYGDGGANSFEGLEGNDTIRGGEGADIYRYALGDGNDYVVDWDNDAGVTDRLTFTDVNAGDVDFASTSGEDLVIRLSNGERITVADHFAEDGDNAIEEIEFADGTVLNAEAIRNKSVADQKDNGSGTVIGSDFAETYTHALGDGTYRISDFDNNGRVDRLVFSNVNAGDVSFASDADEDLVITLSNGEKVTVADQFAESGDYAIEEIEFADGTILDLVAIRDKSIADQKSNGTDLVRGSDHAETYTHALGDGSYRISDFDNNGRTDHLVFTDVNSDQVVFNQKGNDLRIIVAATEVITILGQLDGSGNYLIESFEFADGVTWSHTDVAGNIVATVPAANDQTGTESGEAYTHMLGDGSYTITDYDYLANNGTDTLTFTDVNADQVTVSRSGNDLIFTLSNGEQVTLARQLDNDRYHSIESVSFADGITLDQAALRDRLMDEMQAIGEVVGTANTEAYTHALGDGSYTIKDYDYLANDGTDRLTFTDVNADEVTISRSGNDLIFTLSNGEQVTVLNQLDGDHYHAIEEVVFADGTTLTQSELRDRLVSDMKAGGTVVGTENAEAYTHALGDGSYTIEDYDYLANNGSDSLTFTDVNADEVTFSRSGTNLILTLSNGEQVTLVGQLNGDHYRSIETIAFADGSSLNEAEIRDRLVSDMKDGGTVVGSENAENYTHTLGDGSYSLSDYDYLGNNGADSLTLTDVNQEGIFLERIYDDVVISFANGETITLIEQLEESGWHSIESFTFADATTWSQFEFRNRLMHDMKVTGAVVGTENDETYTHALGDGTYDDF